MFGVSRCHEMLMMMVLGVFALLQLVSGGLLFSSLQHNQQGFCYFLTNYVSNKANSRRRQGLNAANAH